MNKKNLDRWEVRLGVVQVVILLGVVTGCMTFAFYLGFFSGKSAGYEVAMESNAASTTKLPIHGETDSKKSAVDVTEQAVSDVYARLNAKVDKELPLEAPSDHDVPSLGSIKETVPNLEPSVIAKEVIPSQPTKMPAEAKSKTTELDEVWDADAPPVSDKGKADVKILGDELPVQKKEQAKNKIDSLFDEEQAPEKNHVNEKAVVKEVAKPTSAPTAQPTVTSKKEVKVVEPKKEEVQKVAAKPADGAGIIRGKIPSGWFAQVAAPTKLKDADDIAARLKKSGFRVVIETADVRGESYYRILVGPESNRKQADLLVDQLKRENYLQGAPFVKMVK